MLFITKKHVYLSWTGGIPPVQLSFMITHSQSPSPSSRIDFGNLGRIFL